MSFKAVLNVAGQSIEVDYFELDINQAVDARSRPASLSRGGIMVMEFDTPSDNDAITDWMANPVKQLDGSIIFKNQNQDSTMKTINFYNAYCINMIERFDGTMDSSNMKTTITVSPERINVGGVELDNKWFVSGTGGGEGSKVASDKSNGKGEEKPTPGLKSTALAAKVPTPCDNVKTSTDLSKTKKVRYTARQNVIKAANASNPSPALKANIDRFETNNTAIERAKLSEHIYSWGKSPGDKDAIAKMPEGWKIKEGFVKDKDGFAYAVYESEFEKPSKPVLVFRGTDNVDAAVADWKTNAMQGMGMETAQYTASMKKAKELKKKYDSTGIDIAGHSKAGGQAAAAGIVTGQKTYTFNAAGVHSNTIKGAGKTREDASKPMADGKPLVNAYNFPHDVLNYVQDQPQWKKAATVSTITSLGTKAAVVIPIIGPVISGIGMIAAPVLGAKVYFNNEMPPAVGKRTVLPAQDINGNPIAEPSVTQILDRVKYHNMPFLIDSMEKQKKDDLKVMANSFGCK
jgi:Hemolysin coregulated protein Hcp (TssD)